MLKRFLKSFALPDRSAEEGFFAVQRRTCYSTEYPFCLFPNKGLTDIDFGNVTFLYGGNGSGKTTLLNVIAEKISAARRSAFGGSAFFKDYVDRCDFELSSPPDSKQILTSDDVFDYMLNIRYLNEGIDTRRLELFDEYLDKKYAKVKFQSLEDYDNWKEYYDAKSKTQSKYVVGRLMRNVEMHSNGESAFKFFVDQITENSLYLLDEPENSLSISFQKDLCKYIESSAKHFDCQFIIATHSPILLSMENAVIYDLDQPKVCTKKWTELENVISFFNFFEEHRAEFLNKGGN